MLNIGIVSNAYEFGNRTKQQQYSLMRQHGYTYIDFQGLINTETEQFRSDEHNFEKWLKQERETARECGLSVYQAHGPWRWPVHDSTKEERAERMIVTEKAIRGAAYLGASVLVIHCRMPFGANSPEHPEELWKINEDTVGKLCETAKEYGITIGFENLPFPLLPLSRTNEILAFIQKMHSPQLKMCLDTGHCAVYGDSPADAVRAIGPLLCAMHVHDNNGKQDLHWNPGQGVINWSDFSQALGETGFQGIVSLETKVSGCQNEAEQLQKEEALAEFAKKIARGQKF